MRLRGYYEKPGGGRSSTGDERAGTSDTMDHSCVLKIDYRLLFVNDRVRRAMGTY